MRAMCVALKKGVDCRLSLISVYHVTVPRFRCRFRYGLVELWKCPVPRCRAGEDVLTRIMLEDPYLYRILI